MALANNPQTENKTPEEAFRELRVWVDERLRAKGLLDDAAARMQRTRQEVQAVTLGHIEQLKADIEALIKLEGRRGFWAQVGISAVFFVLGVLAGAVSL